MVAARATFVEFTSPSNSLKSWYHIWDTGTGGFLYYFGGDYMTLSNAAINYPASGALAKLSDVAKAKNLTLVAVNAPDTDGTTNGYTWWENLPGNGVFFRDLHSQLVMDNPLVDPTNLWFAGYSGGAEFISYEVFYRGIPGFKSGGGIMVGGGGAFNPAATTQGQALKTTAALYWYVGDQDVAGATFPADWSAYDTATKAVQSYKTAGFNATLKVLPGKNHDNYDTSAYVAEVVPVAQTAPSEPAPSTPPPAGSETLGEVTVIRALRQDGRLPTAAVAHVKELLVGMKGPTELTNAVELSKAAATEWDEYDTLAAQAEIAAAGTQVFTDQFDDTTKWAGSYGAWVAKDLPGLSYSGKNVAVLPWNNTNTQNLKPVHMYSTVGVPVKAGVKYKFRLWLRTRTATPGTGPSLLVLVAKEVNNAAQYWTITPATGIAAAGVNPNGYTPVDVDWTATETTTIRIGPQGRGLTDDLLVGRVDIYNTTTAKDMSAAVATAKREAESADKAAVSAWQAITPRGSIGGGGTPTVILSRAEHSALPNPDPNVLYLVRD